MKAPKLSLYYYESCPFCQVVLRAIDRLDIHVELCDILENEEHLNQLLSDTGRRTVPCLYIDGTPMHESADIIRWLDANQPNLTKKK